MAEKTIGAIAYKVVEIPELMVNDERLGEIMGKNKRQIQRLLREMEKNPVGCQYISHDGGRCTDPYAFKAWLLWYENQKYKAVKKPFSYGG